MKWWLHSCPRCGGDLYEDVYTKGEDVVCLQCGIVMTRQAFLNDVPPSEHVNERCVPDGQLAASRRQ